MKYAYVRVSTVEQKIERQLDSLNGLDVDRVFVDKQSGKNFERTAYQKMKAILKKGDLLILHSIDRLGRNYKDILKEWRCINQDTGCDIVVLDMPLLDTRGNGQDDVTGALISDIVLQVLAYVAQKERDNLLIRQREGINAAKLRGTYNPGRPTKLPENYIHFCQLVEKGQLSVTEAARQLGISRSSWYNWQRAYPQTPPKPGKRKPRP